jgi:hypothetical protein
LVYNAATFSLLLLLIALKQRERKSNQTCCQGKKREEDEEEEVDLIETCCADAKPALHSQEGVVARDVIVSDR